VWGRATDATLDNDSQVIDPAWSGPELKRWCSTGGNVRMSHNPQRPIGKGISAETDAQGATWVRSMICDPLACKFIRKGILTSYSVGISSPKIRPDPSGRARNGIICGGQIAELTVCDRGSNPSCGITIAKSVGGVAEYVGKVYGKPKKARKAAKAELNKALAAWDASSAGQSAGMQMRLLERIARTSDNAFEREAAYSELTKLRL
jgi:hypothetical protein